jgi:hypothetical protein
LRPVPVFRTTLRPARAERDPRRQNRFLSAAATSMIGLACNAAAQERRDDAQVLLDEPSAIAAASQADRLPQQVNRLTAIPAEATAPTTSLN